MLMEEPGFWDSVWEWLGNQGVEILFVLVIGTLIFYFSGPVVDWVRRNISDRAGKRSKMPRNEIRKRNKTIGNMIVVLIHTTVIAVMLFTILIKLGVDVTPLIASAGILGIALGFGTQSLVKDALTGFFIIAETQYRVGDYILISGIGVKDAEGTVEKISLRTTKLRDREGDVHFVPNGSIVQVSNRTMGYGKIHFEFEVDAKLDVEKIEKIIDKVGDDLARDPEWKEKVLEPPHFVEISNFGGGSMELVVSGKTQPADQWLATSEYRKRLLDALDAAKIKIQ